MAQVGPPSDLLVERRGTPRWLEWSSSSRGFRYSPRGACSRRSRLPSKTALLLKLPSSGSRVRAGVATTSVLCASRAPPGVLCFAATSRAAATANVVLAPPVSPRVLSARFARGRPLGGPRALVSALGRGRLAWRRASGTRAAARRRRSGSATPTTPRSAGSRRPAPGSSASSASSARAASSPDRLRLPPVRALLDRADRSESGRIAAQKASGPEIQIAVSSDYGCRWVVAGAGRGLRRGASRTGTTATHIFEENV